MWKIGLIVPLQSVQGVLWLIGHVSRSSNVSSRLVRPTSRSRASVSHVHPCLFMFLVHDHNLTYYHFHNTVKSCRITISAISCFCCYIFWWQLANYEFFERLEQGCCGQLKHYEMSVFKPSTTDVQPATLADSIVQHVEDTASRSSLHRSALKFDSGTVSSLSLALSLSMLFVSL